MNKLQQMQKELSDLQQKIAQEERKQKAKKGILKPNEWLLVTYPKDPDNEGWDTEVVFYNACDTVVCMNAYVDPPAGAYICDIKEECERSNNSNKPIKAKKISAQEAIRYLK